MAEVQALDKLSLQQLEKEVTCGICQEFYTDPKILPCFHYYCKQCVQKIALRTAIDEPFQCPECRSKAVLPGDGVDGLKSAFFINRFKSMFSTLQRAHGKVEAKCEACSADRAESFCRQCALFICKKCTVYHLTSKSMFLNHQVVSLQDLREGKARSAIIEIDTYPQKCPDHNENMKVFCYDCNSIICRDCTVVDHKDHKFQFSKLAAPAAIVDLKKELGPLKKIGERLSRAVEKVKITREEVKAQGASVAQTVNTAFDELVQILEQHRKELLEETKKRVQEKIDKLTVQEKTLCLANAEVHSVIDYTERCVSYCSDNEVLSMHKDTKEKILKKRKEFNKESRWITPEQEADLGVKIHCAEDIKSICQTKTKFFKIPVDLNKCKLEGEGQKTGEIGKAQWLTLTASMLTNGKTTTRSTVVTSLLKSLHNESIIKCVVDRSGPGKYLIRYTPTVRGRHELTVAVDGCHIAGSPFPVYVSIHPSQLGKTMAVWNNFERPAGLAIHSRGGLIAVKRSDDMIVHITKDGSVSKLISRKELKLDSYIPLMVETDDQEFLYLTLYYSNSLYKLTTEGGVAAHAQSDKYSGLYGLALVGEEVMVCPRPSKGTIMVYTRQLKYSRKITGKGMGQFRDISSDSHGNLYVSDLDKSSIHVLSNHGDALMTFGSGVNKKESLTRPLGVCVSGQYVYVCNNGLANSDHSIFVFTVEGNFVTNIRVGGLQNERFGVPSSVCVDHDGFVYFCDFVNSIIKKI